MQKVWWKTTKNWIGALTESYRERKSWKTFEKVSLNTWKSVFKKFSTQFSIDRKIDSIGRKYFDWSNTNRAPIKTDRDSQTFLIAISINRKTILISRNSRKISFFEKQSKIMQKLLKALNFMNHMNEYEMKCFSKTHVLNLVFPKLRFSIHSLKISNIKYVLHKNQGIFKLGWTNQKHTQ